MDRGATASLAGHGGDTPLERLAARQFVFVTGKGGTGKTTVSAALALLLAGLGRRVLLLELDPRECAHQLLGVEPSGGEIVEVRPGLCVQNLRPRAELDRIVLEHVRIEFLARRVLDSPVYQHFAEAAPGLKELAVLWHARRAVESESGADARFDLVVLDAPATGHGLALLSAPRDAAEVVREGPVGRVARALDEFVADAGRAAVVLTTLAEEMPLHETLELVAALERRIARRPDLIVVNGLWPAVEDSGAAGAARAPASDALWYRRREINDRELAHLEAAWAGPRVDLPLLAIDRGPALAGALAEWLGEALSEAWS